MRPRYRPSMGQIRVYVLGVWALACSGTILAMNARHVPSAVVGIWRAAWVAWLVVGVLAGWRWLWHALPWWARVLPMLSIACFAVSLGLFVLLMGASIQSEQAILDVAYRVMVGNLFATLLGMFGVLVAVGFNQAHW